MAIQNKQDSLRIRRNIFNKAMIPNIANNTNEQLDSDQEKDFKAT